MGPKEGGGEALMHSCPLRFICDEQLGRLAKWLRLEGFDTLYECPMEDQRLLSLAQAENRYILTRDRKLSAKTLWDAIVVIENTECPKQLRELKKKISLPKAKPFSRCLICNQLIHTVSKDTIKDLVPDEVYRTYEEFYTCPVCKKVYWKGSHVAASKARLRLLKL